jgi:hypothetical protein
VAEVVAAAEEEEDDEGATAPNTPQSAVYPSISLQRRRNRKKVFYAWNVKQWILFSHPSF